MPILPDAPTPDSQPKIYQCGSLTYTSRRLMVLFFWLLWGDFVYMVTQAVATIMPIKFQQLGASNFEMGLILSTIPSLIYSILNPVISFKSDRFRSRWGRRVPFILFPLPFLLVFNTGAAFGDRIGFWLQHTGIFGLTIGANTLAVWTIGFFVITGTFFNTFLSSTFWYLFNDVVPEHLLARFMSWFRVISTLSVAFFNFCIFRFADTHYAAIMMGSAILAFIGYSLMCVFVKEGAYPPPPAYVDGQTGPLAAIKTYAQECLGIRHYWYQWMGTFIGSIGGGMFTFLVLFNLAIGLNASQYGNIQGWLNIASAVFVLGAGWLADRIHPIRVCIIGSLFGLFISTPATLIWLFWHPAPHVVYWVSLAISIGLAAPCQALVAMSDPPLLMRIFPKSRYGQFCSTNGIWRAIGGIIGGTVAGGFLDILGHFVGKQQAYFYIPVWQIVFMIPSTYLLFRLYKSWKQYGGDASYVPPMIKTEPQTEEVPAQTMAD